MKKTPVKYLGFMVGNSPIKTTEESEADDCADPPDLTTDRQTTQDMMKSDTAPKYG